MNIKKCGFTLTEILLVLGAIGVVAALTVPSLVSENQNRLFASKLSSTITTLENAFTTMMAAEGVISLNDIEDFEEKISKYLKIERLEDYGPNYEEGLIKNQFGKTIDGKVAMRSSEYMSCGDIYHIYRLKNNALTHLRGCIVIDVNGDAKPNVFGRDLFLFEVTSKGKLLAYGSRALTEINTWAEHWSWSSKISYACNNSNKGIGCTGRLVENNFVMDY